MPITLPPISRRRFLAGSMAAGASVLVARPTWAAEPATDANRFALLSDTHVAGERDHVERGVNMFAHAQEAVREVALLDPRPAAAIINGDCAFLHGKQHDYEAFVEAVKPLREAGLTLHCTLGNHDHRERFWKAIPATAGQDQAVDERHITVIESARANWFLLDSLDLTNATPGTLGADQLTWLARALDARTDRPALVMLHHPPDPELNRGGLTDTGALLEVLISRPHVKAYFYGHNHVWIRRQQQGLHLVGLPAVAYTFSPEQPSGWIDAHLTDTGITLALRSIDPTHSQHGEKVELLWRS